MIDITQKLNDEKNNTRHIEEWKILGQNILNKKNKTKKTKKVNEDENV
jgi:hypothetical protein